MKGVFSCVKYEVGDVYTVNLLMKNIGILVVFLATIFLSTKSIWAKLIYLDSLSPLSVLAYRALLSLPFFILPMIHFNWQSVNKKEVFKYSFVGAVLYLISSMVDFIGLLYISASLERAVLFTFPIYVFLLSSDLSRITISKIVLIILTILGLGIMFNPTVDSHFTVNDTLRMYKNDDIRMYNFNCITDTIVEVITTCNTYTLLTVHLL